MKLLLLSLLASVAVAQTITNTSLPSGTVGTAYSTSQPLSATGGQAPYAWSLSVGSLPPGLTLTAAQGTISGIPTVAGMYPFTVTVTDALGKTATQALSITVYSDTLTITPTTLIGGFVGQAYSQRLTAAGGQGPYTWSLIILTIGPTGVSGPLPPPGLTLNASTGVIGGTPTFSGTYPFQVQVIDSSGIAIGHQSLSITVFPAPGSLMITTTSLPNATLNSPYSQTLVATGGTSPYTWAVTGGALPPGLTLNASTGIISGTPSAVSATGFGFYFAVTDAAHTTAQQAYLFFVNNAAAPAPTATLTGVPANSGFEQQIPLTLSINPAPSAAITGSIVLTFTPSVVAPANSTGAVDDLMIQFSNGSRVINFTVPSGSTTATLTNASSITVLTGTTAGTISLITTLFQNGEPLGPPTTQSIVTNAGVPFLTNVSFKQTPGSIVVTVVGFTSTRDMISGEFNFAPATTANVPQPDVAVALTGAFSTWFANTAQSNPYGTEFTLTAPFSLNTQSTALVSVTVTLTNSKGTSNSITLSQ